MLAESSGWLNGGAYLQTDRSSVRLDNVGAEYTLEAWVNRVDTNRCEAIVTSGYDVNHFSNGFWFGLCDGGRPYFQSNTLGSTASTGNTVVPQQVWTHLAVTRNATEERIYVNGELDLVAPTGVQPNRNQPTLYVGAAYDELGHVPTDLFWGNLSEVRVWQTIRSQDEIRRSMHELMEGTSSGLLAAWHLNGDANESAHAFPTTNVNLCLCGPTAPPTWRVTEVDANFNRLSEARFFGAGTTVPATNTAYLIGGYDSSLAVRSEILAMDMSTGETTSVANLPFAAGSQTSAYVPANNSLYIFGGDIQNVAQNEIVKYDLTTKIVTQLPAVLPTALYFGSAVWHPGIQRVVVIGGYAGTASDSILLFDPASETVTQASVKLPAGRYNAAVAYSPLTDRIYVFGGNDDTAFLAGTRTSYELAIKANGTGVVTTLPAAELPLAHVFATAVEDPKSHLIHILGGTAEYVQTFDPRTGKTWRTTIRMPRNYNNNADGAVLNTPYQTVVYSPRNRHALVIAGGTGGVPTNKVWRVPLGDGPAIPIERWDFVNDLTGKLAGDDRGVYVSGDGNNLPVTGVDENGNRSTYGFFGGNVNDIAYSPDSGLWVASSGFGAYQFRNGTTVQYSTPELGTAKVYSVQPEWPSFGTDQGLTTRNIFGGGYGTYFQSNVTDTVYSQTGSSFSTWATVRGGSAVDSGSGPWRLGHAYRTIDDTGLPFTEAVEFPSVCGDASPWRNFGLQSYRDIVQDLAGNLWVVGTGQGSEAVCLLPSSSLAGTPSGGLATTLNGNNATSVDVDADNRVWVGLASTERDTGGLTVYEANSSGALRNTDFNWRNAPIGSRNIVTGGPALAWSSSITSVAGVDEKVWATKAAGGLVSVAQRWQQLDEVLANQTVNRLWTVAGRTFFDTAAGLYVLQPDGQTYEYRNTGDNPTHVVASDGAGNIWLGSHDGPRLYQSTGFDDLSSRAGTRPAGDIFAIVETPDSNPSDNKAAPVWIGGTSGLTLFDRDRFVTTFTASNSPLPSTTVNAILVDSHGNVWAGTTGGLTRLSADRATWTTFTTANGLPSNSIFDLAQLGGGRIAISTDNGLSLYDGAAFATQSPPVSAVNLPLSVDSLGRLWAGSGLLTAAGWRGYWSTNSGLKSSTISDTATDGSDRIWFSHAPHPGVSVRGTFLPPLKDFTPIITSYSPVSGSSGTTVTINGLSLGADPSEIAVTIGGSPVDIVSATESQVLVRLRDATTSGAVSLTRGGKRTTSSTPFCAVPVINGFTPTGGSAGVEVQVTGTNFDPDAKVQFSGGSPHAAVATPTTIDVIVDSTDATGAVRVQNHCEGMSKESGATFRKITPTIPVLNVNQGMSFYGLVKDKPTLVSAFLNTNGAVSATEKVEIDEAQLAFQYPDGTTSSQQFRFPNGYVAPNMPGAPSAAQLKDTANSVVLNPIYFGVEGANQMTTTLYRRGRTVASTSQMVDVAANEETRVLMVPVMPAGYTQQQVNAVRANIDANVNELRQRLMPMGTVSLDWSPEIVTTSPFDLKAISTMDLAFKGIDLGRARNHWNESHPQYPADIVLGIMDPSVTMGTTPGVALPNSAAAQLNSTSIDFADAVCDLASGVVSALTFGLFGSSRGCNTDFVERVAWIVGGPHAAFGLDAAGNPDVPSFQNNVARTMAHEMGHTLDLVSATALDGSATDNPAHSVNDEIAGTNTCSSMGATYDVTKTLYRQPGVLEPIVNPLSGMTLLPQLGGDMNTLRAKSIMSYACKRQASLVFFEPADVTAISPRFAPLAASLRNGAAASPSLSRGAGVAETGIVAAAVTSAKTLGLAPRLHVAGTINLTAGTGDLSYVESFGDSGPLTLSFVSEYAVVQLDGSGTELSRLGVVSTFGKTDNPEEPTGSPTFGYFAATMVRQPAVTRVELRRGDIVLASFSAGEGTPQVTLISPVSGSVDPLGEFLNVAWTAADADGDPLSMIVDYSSDDGMTWSPAASVAAGVTSVNIPLAQLPATAGTGRVRVTASDGLHNASVVSDPFTVLAVRPLAYIDGAETPLSTHEGERIVLTGFAADNLDGILAGDRLSWSSDLEGELGTGNVLPVALMEVGTHTVTLTATNSLGMAATETRNVVVIADYDYDGIGDALEPQLGMNPLNGQDVHLDADGDTLSFLVEYLRGLNPNAVDSDSDGRNDDVEVAAGTDPTRSDAPLAADRILVSPTRVDLVTDLAGGVALPQATLALFSRGEADWSLTSDVDWLKFEAIVGTTPAQVLMLAEAYRLADGTHSATVTIHSTGLNTDVDVPVTLTIVHGQAWFDLDGNGTANSLDCNLAQSLVGSAVGDARYDYRFDVDRNGIIDAGDVGDCNVATGGVPIRGDFNGDRLVNVQDLDLLFAAIRAGDSDDRFELDGKSGVNEADATVMVEDILGTRRGDVNLDRDVDFADFLILAENFGSIVNTWEKGDFNGDGLTGFDDFLQLADTFGFRAAEARL